MTFHHRLFRHCLLAAPLLLAAMPVAAQQEDEQLWTQINTNVPLAKDWRVTLEQIARFSDRQDGLFQTEFGGIVGHKLNKHVEIGFGYRWVGAHNGNSGANENRVRQHILLTYGSFFGRFRVDERFNPRGNEIGIRIRPLLRYNHKIGTDGWAAFISHESFILPNGTSWGQRRGYERMRNIIGATLPVVKQVSADVGYLNQYRFGRSGAQDQMDHALTVQLTINLTGRPHPPEADD